MSEDGDLSFRLTSRQLMIVLAVAAIAVAGAVLLAVAYASSGAKEHVGCAPGNICGQGFAKVRTTSNDPGYLVAAVGVLLIPIAAWLVLANGAVIVSAPGRARQAWEGLSEERAARRERERRERAKRLERQREEIKRNQIREREATVAEGGGRPQGQPMLLDHQLAVLLKGIIVALAVAFGAVGAAAAVGIPVLAFYFPLGFGLAAAVLILLALPLPGRMPWYVILAVVGAALSLLQGIAGFKAYDKGQKQLDKAQQELRGLGGP